METDLTDQEARRLLHRAGSTPAYVYSRSVLRSAVQRVRAASLPGAGIYYSLKANPHPGVVGCLSTMVDGFDVCSPAEMETALNAGMAPEQILFTGPAKSRREAAVALAAGVAVTVESPGQAALLVEVAREIGVTGRGVVRLNTAYPGREPGAAASPNQFGVAAADIVEVVRVLRASPVALTGMQVFWGSQYHEAKVIIAARAAAVDRVRALADTLGLTLTFVSVGGGIAMPWLSDDPAVEWDPLRTHGAGPAPDSWTVVCEYGRAIVGPAGSLLTTVLDTKTVDGRRYVLVDAGMNHVLIASRLVAGRGRGEPSVRVVEPGPGPVTTAVVTGPLCSQLDVLADGVPLPPIAVGDILVFSGVGAYGPSFSPVGFLSRDTVAEIVY